MKKLVAMVLAMALAFSLAVLKTLGVETPETYALDAVLVTGKDLTAEDTMQTLNKYFADFGSTDAFDTDEIKALREKFAK